MEGGPLLQDWWTAESKNFVLYLNITSKVDTHPDQGMLQKKGGNGFPYVVMMDSGGEVLTTFRPNAATDVQAAAAKANDFVSARDASAKNPKDDDAKARYLMVKLTMKPDEAERKALDVAMKGKVSKATKEKFDGFVAGERIKSWEQGFRTTMRAAKPEEREATQAAEAVKAYEAWKGGMKPPTDDVAWLNYAMICCGGAIKSGDKAGAEGIVTWIETFSVKFPQLKDTVKKMREDIANIGKTETPKEAKEAK